MKNFELLFVFLAVISVVSSVFIGYTLTPAPIRSIEFNAPAVTLDGSGTLGSFKMTLVPGTGKTLVNVEKAAFLTDVENSLRKAKSNAEKITGVKLVYYDVILEANHVNVVSGESAGAVLTAAIVALSTGSEFDAATTGSAGVTLEGKVFAVAGIEEKILAARSAGKRKFVVSSEQEIRNLDKLPKDIEVIKVTSVREAVEKLVN